MVIKKFKLLLIYVYAGPACDIHIDYVVHQLIVSLSQQKVQRKVNNETKQLLREFDDLNSITIHSMVYDPIKL